MNKKSLENGLKPSAMRNLYEAANKRKLILGKDQVFDYSIGNPCAPVPSEYKEAVAKAVLDELEEGNHAYTSNAGLIETREAVAKNLNRRFATNFDGHHIYLTCGAASSLAITFNAILEKDEEAIVFVPYFPEYRIFVDRAGGELVTVKSEPKTFYPDFSDLEKQINAKTRMIIINSPNNPTGVIYPSEVLTKLAELLQKKQKEFGKPIYLVSDEPYRELIYTEEKYQIPVKYYKNTVICYSFSKSLSIPGDRFGYIAIGEECEDRDNLFIAILGAGRRLGYVCAPRPIQEAMKSVLELDFNTVDFYKENRDNLFNILSNIGYEVTSPDGAFYLFVKALEEDANKFSEKAKEFNLFLVPSDSFGVTGYVRIAYCVSRETIANSAPAFKKLYDYYKGDKR